MLKIANASLRAAALSCLLLFLAACNSSSSSVSSVSITTSALPSGTVGAVYGATLAAINGQVPYTFSVTSGALPAGVTLASTGSLSGVPTVAATSTVTITVSDAQSRTASQAFNITIVPGAVSPITITPATLAPGTVGTAYTATFAAANGTAPYTFSVASGALPAGLTLSTAGILSGTPTASGTSSFAINAVDAKGLKATVTYSLTIAPAHVSIATTSLPNGVIGTAYTGTVAAANGTPPYTFAISTGTPPAGLTFSSAGILSGTPTTAATSAFTVTVTDSTSQTASASLTVLVTKTALAPLTLGPATLPAAIVNTAYTTTLQAAGGTAPYTIALTAGTLPTGLTLTSAGVLSGTATATGTFTFTAKLTDANTQSVSTAFTLNVVTATVAVDTATVITTVPSTFFGLHTSVYDTNFDGTANLPALLKTTGISTLRYPGGNYADLYHWAQNSLTPAYTSTVPSCGTVPDGILSPNSDFGNFVHLLASTGTQGLITVNYGTSVANSTASLSSGSTTVPNRCSEPNTAGQPEEAAAWVAFANGATTNTHVIGVDAAGFDWKTVGYWASLRAAQPLAQDDGYNFLRLGQAAPVGIKYWEIGNEIYYNGWSHNLNPEDDLHAPYIYPNGYSAGNFDSRESLPALSPTAYGTNAGPFITAMKAVDPSILIGVDFSSPGATDPIPLTWDPDLAQSVCATSSIDLAIIHYYPGTYNAVQPAELLSLPQSDLPTQVAFIQSNLAKYCSNAASIKFWLTETSPNGNLAPDFPAYATGLFALNDFLSALKAGALNIDWLQIHNGTYLDESDNPGPAYYGIQLAHLLAGIGDSLVTATSSSPTVLSFATHKTTGEKGVLLVNADPANSAVVQVTVTGSTLGATATQYSFGAATTQSGAALTGTPFTVSGNTFTITVPPYTATDLIIQ